MDSAVLTSQGALSKAADVPSLAIRQLQGLLTYLSLVHPPCPLIGCRGQKRVHQALSLHVALQLAFTFCWVSAKPGKLWPHFQPLVRALWELLLYPQRARWQESPLPMLWAALSQPARPQRPSLNPVKMVSLSSGR